METTWGNRNNHICFHSQLWSFDWLIDLVMLLIDWLVDLFTDFVGFCWFFTLATWNNRLYFFRKTESESIVEVNPQHFPSCLFSRVKSYAAMSEAPLVWIPSGLQIIRFFLQSRLPVACDFCFIFIFMHFDIFSAFNIRVPWINPSPSTVQWKFVFAPNLELKIVSYYPFAVRRIFLTSITTLRIMFSVVVSSIFLIFHLEIHHGSSGEKRFAQNYQSINQSINQSTDEFDQSKNCHQ